MWLLRKVGVSGVFALQYIAIQISSLTISSLYLGRSSSVRDIADVDNGTWRPECLLSRDLFGLTETLYVLMHFLSIGNF